MRVLAVSGVKDSGKTSLIERMIPLFKRRGLKVGTIKHDGHDFEPDVEGTDSYLHRQAGADGVAVFSDKRWMLIKEEVRSEREILREFQAYDLVILEGFKASSYPKLEVIRGKVSQSPVSRRDTVLAYVTDLDRIDPEVEQFDFDDLDGIVAHISRALGLEEVGDV